MREIFAGIPTVWQRCASPINSGKPSLTISAKPVGAEAASQRLIPTGERFGLRTRIATMESVSLCGADEKLTAFVELESALFSGRRLALEQADMGSHALAHPASF
jgi:hypothetical protein